LAVLLADPLDIVSVVFVSVVTSVVVEAVGASPFSWTWVSSLGPAPAWGELFLLQPESESALAATAIVRI
jgi:hypothetical protein